MTGFIDPSIRAARKKEQSQHSKGGLGEMSIKRQEAAVRLPCPVCGQSCRAEVVLKHKEEVGLPQSSQEPIGYGYSHEIQSGLGSYFIVVREKQNKYDTPIYADTRPDREGK